MVNGSLCIPQFVIDKGLLRLRSALVAQFVGSVPPIRVITAVANRIWGYEGEVIISKLDDGFFLLEFASEALANWVLKRSWHIHNSIMILRKWEKNIKKVELAPESLPVWVVFKKVPPALMTDEGISWISSNLGDPVNRFVRTGLDVKVCLLRKLGAREVEEVSVTLEGEEIFIAVEFLQARVYSDKRKKKPAQEWREISKEQEVAKEIEQAIEIVAKEGVSEDARP
ncbi:hypothetical protein LINPERPRIM_LOCUS32762 [Linum perenne]